VPANQDVLPGLHLLLEVKLDHAGEVLLADLRGQDGAVVVVDLVDLLKQERPRAQREDKAQRDDQVDSCGDLQPAHA